MLDDIASGVMGDDAGIGAVHGVDDGYRHVHPLGLK
jgi:hypothetical protein